MERPELQIVYKDIKELKPFARNPKEHPKTQIDNIAQSITKYGWRAPILVSFETGEIVAGHGRLLAAKKLKLKSVPCIDASDMSQDEIAEYRYLDNKLNESAWNFEIVAEDLNQLDFSGFDLEWEGFDAETNEDEPEVQEAEVDEESVPDEPRAKQGDIYQLGRHRLMCGDSTDVSNLDRLFHGASIDLVLSDPPYGVSVVDDEGKVGADFGVAAKGNYIKVKGDETTDTAREFYHACKACNIDRFILFGGNYFTDFLPFSDGWIMWDKRCESGIKNTFADGELAWCSFHTPVRIYRQLWNGMIREGEKDKRVHPTQKPVRMMSEILRDFSKEGNNIFDGFGGSGSTLMACEQTERNCYMIEYEPHYVDVIIARWEQLTGEKAVLLTE